MRGRKPIPTVLKIMRGNPGHRPLNAQEPIYPSAVPKPPKHLGIEARKEWRRITRLLNSVGLIAEVDLVTLTGYCTAWGRLVDAESKIIQYGVVLQGDKGFYQSPYLSIANKALVLLMKYSALFGFDPSSRVRLNAPGGGEEKAGPLQGILKRVHG